MLTGFPATTVSYRKTTTRTTPPYLPFIENGSKHYQSTTSCAQLQIASTCTRAESHSHCELPPHAVAHTSHKVQKHQNMQLLKLKMSTQCLVGDSRNYPIMPHSSTQPITQRLQCFHKIYTYTMFYICKCKKTSLKSKF